MEIREPIAKKFGTVDYVREATPSAKFRANPSTGGFSTNAWNITEIFPRYTFFQKITYRSDRLMDFHVQWLKRRGLTQGCAFLGYKVQNQYLIREENEKGEKLTKYGT